MSIDFFKNKAQGYEGLSQRVENVDQIANTILKTIHFKPDMQIMDFGSGTGLLLERIAPSVKSISAVDISSSMNEQLERKRGRLQCDLEIIEMDLSRSVLNRTFDGIVSSMTMHHVADIQSMLNRFYSMLSPGGFIALADLDKENGSFHTEDTGVFHFGFERQAFADLAGNSGFKRAAITTSNIIRKPYGDFPVFLLTAYR